MLILFYLHTLVLCEFRVGDGSRVLRVLSRGGGEGRIPIYKKKRRKGSSSALHGAFGLNGNATRFTSTEVYPWIAVYV
jgi:hypothetical protein